MESLERLHRRMDTAAGLRDLVRTMRTLAAVSVRHYERALGALETYDHTIELGLRAVLRTRPVVRDIRRKGPRESGVLVLGSDQGLCGPFNEQVVARVEADVEAGTLILSETRVLAVGARAAARLEEAGIPVEAETGVAASVALLPVLVQDLLVVVDRWRELGDLGEIVLYHQRPKPPIGCRPHRERLLPFDADRIRSFGEAAWPTRMLPMLAGDPTELLGALTRQHLFVGLHRALAQSSASEHASRLLAMQAAERNIDERLEDLRAEYHRRRQAAITTELLDIVAGAEAQSS